MGGVGRVGGVGGAGKTSSRTLERVRRLCLALPETRETAAWGHPVFKAGTKTFAAIDRLTQWFPPFLMIEIPSDRALQATFKALPGSPI